MKERGTGDRKRGRIRETENRTEEAAADGCGGEEETMGEKQAPSIFNDVLGPIMRGPSSSHVAGAARIGEIGRAHV